METNDKLLELVEFVETARAMPLSSSVLVNKQELLERLDEIRQGLPSTMGAADEIIAMSESIIADARGKATQIIQEAKSEQARLVADHSVLHVARNEAEQTRTAAHEAAEAEKRDVDDYLDAKLAHIEMVAERMLDSARSGRERLRGATTYDALGEGNDQPPGELTSGKTDKGLRDDIYDGNGIADSSAILFGNADGPTPRPDHSPAP
jgi:hypothetical protein